MLRSDASAACSRYRATMRRQPSSRAIERRRDKTFDDGPLIAEPPQPGRVVSTSRDAAADAIVWTLSNGVRVIAKPTAFRNASVVLRGFQNIGWSSAPENVKKLTAAVFDELRTIAKSGSKLAPTKPAPPVISTLMPTCLPCCPDRTVPSCDRASRALRAPARRAHPI